MRAVSATPATPASGAAASHVVAVLALDGVVGFDLSIPCEVFGRTILPDGTRPYAVRVCGPSEAVRSGHFDIRPPFGLDALESAETIVVPGLEDPSCAVPPAVLDALRGAAARGARVASICSGAFVLAAAGLLDGRRATTHWLAADRLAERHPNVVVDPNVLFVDDGAVLTSAGAAAGLDLCLHMVLRDHGAAVAAEAARTAVMPLAREGGQAQFIARPPPACGETLAPLLGWLAANLDRPLRVEDLAARAGTSARTFGRRFREQTGATPLQWLLLARVRRAQALLERTALPVERVATETGFVTAATFRDRFARIVGLSPTAYRRAFGAGVPTAAPSTGAASVLRPSRDRPM